MSRLCFITVSPVRNSYPYVFPYKYSESYIGHALKPERYTYSNYTQKSKGEYVNQCVRYVEQGKLHDAFEMAKQDSSVKMYSLEAIGWTQKEFQVTDNIKVCVSTNFGYGFSSYFMLAISYKDIVIAPFSFLVKYYHARMVDIVSCTRAYSVERDSWIPLFNFVKEFANKSLSDPVDFVNHYLMNEVDEMMVGLRNLMKKPNYILENFYNECNAKNEYSRFCFISPMSDEDKKLYEDFRGEMPVVFKSEKLACAVKILAKLDELVPVYSKIKKYVVEIRRMARETIPEIKAMVQGFQKKVDDLATKIDRLERTLQRKERKEATHIKKLDKLLNKLPEDATWEDEEEVREGYRQNNPQYVSLEEEIQSLKNELGEFWDKTYKRKRFITNLSGCLETFKKARIRSPKGCVTHTSK